MDELLVRMGLSVSWIDALQLGSLVRLLLAAFLGGLIGLERELRGKPSGLRTNLLICVGAALLTELSIAFPNQTQGSEALVRADPARIAAQIVTGIGFIGAGTILHARGRVSGLTSAATVWVVAAIGMAVGAGEYVRGAGTAVLVLVALGVLGRLEEMATRRRTRRRYTFHLDAEAEAMERLEAELRRAGLRSTSQSVERENGMLTMRMDLVGPALRQEEAVRALAVLPGIRGVSRDR